MAKLLFFLVTLQKCKRDNVQCPYALKKGNEGFKFELSWCLGHKFCSSILLSANIVFKMKSKKEKTLTKNNILFVALVMSFRWKPNKNNMTHLALVSPYSCLSLTHMNPKFVMPQLLVRFLFHNNIYPFSQFAIAADEVRLEIAELIVTTTATVPTATTVNPI